MDYRARLRDWLSKLGRKTNIILNRRRDNNLRGWFNRENRRKILKNTKYLNASSTFRYGEYKIADYL